jgi:hypothetical protein
MTQSVYYKNGVVYHEINASFIPYYFRQLNAFLVTTGGQLHHDLLRTNPAALYFISSTYNQKLGLFDGNTAHMPTVEVVS